MTNIVANGNAYSDDGSSSRDMQGGGFRQWLLPMLGDAMLQADSGASAASQAQGVAVQASESAEASAQEAADALALVLATGSGWSPVLKIAADGTRYVLQVADWTGGRGAKPAVGYMAATGVVPTVAGGLNIRGAVAYADLTGQPTLGTAAALDVPAAPATAATAAQVVRGDDPRLAVGAERGTQLYTTSQSITKSTFGTASFVLVELWGGGGSGAARVAGVASGGCGGDYMSWIVSVSDLASSTALVIGAGGSSVSASSGSTAGAAGGDTSFGTQVICAGGAAGVLAVTTHTEATMRTGGAGYSTLGGSSIYGGGGGGGSVGGPGGTSRMGGPGGAGAVGATATASPGAAPGGGGGGANSTTGTTATSGAGARGQARLTWW